MKQKPENLKGRVEMVKDYVVYYINERPQRKLGELTPSFYKKNRFLSVPGLSAFMGPPQIIRACRITQSPHKQRFTELFFQFSCMDFKNSP